MEKKKIYSNQDGREAPAWGSDPAESYRAKPESRRGRPKTRFIKVIKEGSL